MATRSRPGNTSQRHGFEFEDMMKASRMFARAANVARNGMESFDVEGFCDPAFGLATSIKTAKGDWIGLADAERFCRIDRPWRLLFGPWVQETDEIKRYDVIHEMIIPLGVMRRIVGELTPEIVLTWHNDIASFAAGEEGATAARRRRDEILAEIKGRHGLLRLDFKIDGKEQRRLQFSIRFSVLEELLADRPDYVAQRRSQPLHVIHQGSFHQYPLPIRLISPPRNIDRSAAEDEIAEDMLFEADVRLAPEGTWTTPAEEPPETTPRRDVPVRREERERAMRDRDAADIRQTTMFP